MSHAKLLEAYIAALPATVVSVVASPNGKRARIETGATAARKAVHARLHFRTSHAEFVLDAVGIDGWAKMPAAELLGLITSTAETLGAPWQTDEEVKAAAEETVAIVVARVDDMRQSGGLKQINADYKRYRQAQMAKAERAVPYSLYLHRFTARMVAQVAERAG